MFKYTNKLKVIVGLVPSGFIRFAPDSTGVRLRRYQPVRIEGFFLKLKKYDQHRL